MRSWTTRLVLPSKSKTLGLSSGTMTLSAGILAREILRALNAPSVLVVSQDSFYKSLTPEQSKLVSRTVFD